MLASSPNLRDNPEDNTPEGSEALVEELLRLGLGPEHLSAEPVHHALIRPALDWRRRQAPGYCRGTAAVS